ncbi:uncharacterized protein E0L32_009831 [Thyridium curvatum]|uniref:Transcription factor domain-containing protein n=1 Tax=Thyridium curvatum TaxID=1093900 RepID=A0A507AHS3_9PEZI|nr:uncharacterized protein E0L32_009831 [Thyridium curvatum]TPX08642.1 hypothetical protein E0L32_009831 [Thyridium curvatum]
MKGSPCTNCQLDCVDCVVKERAPRLMRRVYATDQETRQVFDCTCASPTPERDELELFDETQGFANAVQSSYDGPAEASDKSFSFASSEAATAVLHDTDSPGRILAKTKEASQQPPLSSELPRTDTGLLYESDLDPEFLSDGCGETMLLYTAYPFLAINNLAVMSQQDLAFLQGKGALHVPAKPILDEFIRQYFLQVHPFYPLMDEGDFWSVYRQDAQSRSAPMVPLLVFQAMLFASSNFVPEALIASLGYDNARSARAALYHNAKHARHVNAHLAWETSIGLTVGNLDPREEPQMLRRIWWCCLIRDRFMALGLRRSLQVRKQYPIVYISDFEFFMFLRLIHLSNIMVDLLVLMSPLDNSPSLEQLSPGIPIKCRKDLHRWHERTQQKISSWLSCDQDQGHAVIIHKSILFIFYNAARSATLRQEILLSCYPPEESSMEALTNYERSQQLQDAVINTVECLRELAQLDLSRYLPLSMQVFLNTIMDNKLTAASSMAYITVPLLFHILDVKVLSPERIDEVSFEARHCRLRVLINALKEHRPRYDGIEWISYTLRYAVNLAEMNSARIPKKLVGSWADLLTQQPSFCLRLALTVDLSISQVKIPDDQDFPVILRGSLRPGVSLEQSLSLKTPNRAADFQDMDLIRFVPRNESHTTTKYMKHDSQLKESSLRNHSNEEVAIGEDDSVSFVDNDDQTISPMFTSINTQMEKPQTDIHERSHLEGEAMPHSVMESFDLSSTGNFILEGCESETLIESDLESFLATSNTAVSTGVP